MLAWLYYKIGRHLFEKGMFGRNTGSPKEAMAYCEKGYNWLLKAADKGSFAAMLFIARYALFLKGDDIMPGTEVKLSMCNRILAEGTPKWVTKAKIQYARLVAAYRSEDATAVAQALSYLSDVLENKDPLDADAAFVWGIFYECGIGVQKNEHCALAWYLTSAKAGNCEAMVKLGCTIYHKKDSIFHDEAKEKYWLNVLDQFK